MAYRGGGGMGGRDDGAKKRRPRPGPAPVPPASPRLSPTQQGSGATSEASDLAKKGLAHPARPGPGAAAGSKMVPHNKYAEDKFGIKVCNELVSVPARPWPFPLLKYHGSGREKTCAPSVGQWNMINKKMINGGTVDNWACLSFSRMRPEEVQRRFCTGMLIQMCNATGMPIYPRSIVDIIRSATPNNVENALRDVHRRSMELLSKQGKGSQLQLLIVILPEVSGSYGKIKKAVCETDLGIVSQCCLPRHASRPNKQYLKNVAVKIKVAGCNTVLERAFIRNGIPYVSEVPTIIFVADVTHSPPGEDYGSSIAAVVASMDWPEITKYQGLVSAQLHSWLEVIEDLFSVSKDPQTGNIVNGGMIRELLIAFRRKTGRRPERIIFYRDGVSEGQSSHVRFHEMDALPKACASLEEGYVPPGTFVVVQKSTRIYLEVHGRRDMTDKSGNILPGTVADLMICHPTEFEYYVRSHARIQGTLRPTHYQVLYNENHFTAGALQSLTKKLCDKFPVILQVFIKILDLKSLSMEFPICYTIHQIMPAVFSKCGVFILDPMVKCNNKSASLENTLQSLNVTNGDTIFIQPRLRGGVGNVGSSSKKYLQLLELVVLLGDKLFDIVTLPTVLRKKHGVSFFVSLGPDGKKIGLLILSLLEECYLIDICPDRFSVNDLFYDPSRRRVCFRTDMTCHPYSRERFFQNMEDVGVIISTIFRFDESKVEGGECNIHLLEENIFGFPKGCLPPYVEFLVFDLIMARMFPDLDSDAILRGYFANHCGFKSPLDRLNFWMLFDLHVSYANHGKTFESYTSKLSVHDWVSVVDSCPVMAEVLKHRTYNPLCAFQRWGFCRNHLKHAKDNSYGEAKFAGQFSEKQAEAGLSAIKTLRWQFYYVLRQLAFPSMPIDWDIDPLKAFGQSTRLCGHYTRNKLQFGAFLVKVDIPEDAQVNLSSDEANSGGKAQFGWSRKGKETSNVSNHFTRSELAFGRNMPF